MLQFQKSVPVTDVWKKDRENKHKQTTINRYSLFYAKNRISIALFAFQQKQCAFFVVHMIEANNRTNGIIKGAHTYVRFDSIVMHCRLGQRAKVICF